MATSKPDAPREPPDEPTLRPHAAARWMWPLVLCASGALWALIAHLLAHG